MTNYLVRIKYDGSKFNGFQRLNDRNTVQETIEKALTIIDKQPVLIKGAGRTDKGVHALDQCATFKLKHDIPEKRLKKAINSIVAPYIYIKEVVKVDDDFHARFCVKTKTYVYKIYRGEFDPFLTDYYLFRDNLDVKKMIDASKIFIGEHYFTNYVSGFRKNYASTIYSIDFKEEKDFIYITFKGISFYQYMVRNLVGAMIAYSDGKTTLKEIKDLLDCKEKNQKLPTASPKGLYLVNIEY